VQIGGAAAAVLRGVISPEQQPRMPGAGAGVQAPEASPGRYVRRHDEVTPDDDGCDDVFRVAVRGPGDDPFDIPAKRAPVERLRRWRVSTTLSLLLPNLLACCVQRSLHYYGGCRVLCLPAWFRATLGGAMCGLISPRMPLLYFRRVLVLDFLLLLPYHPNMLMPGLLLRMLSNLFIAAS
jgi:hypothetical protein